MRNLELRKKLCAKWNRKKCVKLLHPYLISKINKYNNYVYVFMVNTIVQILFFTKINLIL